MTMNQVTTFFVLNGYVNGEEGELALREGTEERMPDGWYYLIDDDTNGDGPHEHREEALHYGLLALKADREQEILNKVCAQVIAAVEALEGLGVSHQNAWIMVKDEIERSIS